MELPAPHPECAIHDVGHYVRVVLTGGSDRQVYEYYQHLVMLTLRHSLTRLLIVGKGGGSPYAHLGARDALIALHGVGVPAGFKIAFVPHTDPIRNGYRHAEIEAEKRGLRAKVFAEEEQAIAWLTNPDMH